MEPQSNTRPARRAVSVAGAPFSPLQVNKLMYVSYVEKLHSVALNVQCKYVPFYYFLLMLKKANVFWIPFILAKDCAVLNIKTISQN